MIKRAIYHCVFLLLATMSGHAVIRFASPVAISGDGTIANPWTLQQAFTNAQSGDTINLRGGTYYIPAIISQMNGVTVQSYPGEWAVIASGLGGVLDTALGAAGASSTNIVIDRSESFQPTMAVTIDSEMFQLSATTISPTNWNVNRGWGGTSQGTHSVGAKVWLYSQMAIDHTGTNTIFRGFEVTSLMTTNRVAGTNFHAGGGINLHGANNKVLNCIIHDTGHPGLGFWDQGDGGEMNGCVIWGCGVYDSEGTWIRGGGVYAQNATGSPLVKHNIFFRNLRAGLSMYGGAALINGFRVSQNICFAPGDASANSMQLMTDENPMTNNVISSNFIGAGANLQAVAVGYGATSSVSNSMIGNVIVGGGLTSKEVVSGYYTNNTVFMPYQATDNGAIQFDSHLSSYKTNLSFTWDYNTYYFTNLTRPHQFAYTAKDVTSIASDGSGNLIFTNDSGKSWQDWSGFDLHTTYVTNWPNNYLNIKSFALDYDSNRHFVAVVSTSGATNAVLDLSTNGFGNGDRWTLRDAQNYFNVISVGTYTGGTINLPLNLTNIAQLQGSVTNFIPQHTNIQYPGLFNTFVLDRFSTLNFSGLSKLSGVIIQ